jgi:hydrogenase maturation protease
MKRTCVIGIGNTAQQDDGIGVLLVEEMMQKTWPSGIEFASVGPRVHEITPYMMDKEVLILLDAFNGALGPGTIFYLDYPELLNTVNKNRFFRGPNISLHDASFGYWLETGFSAGFSPQVFFIGIEPAVVDFGYGLSPQLQSSFPGLVLRVVNIERERR